MEIKTKALIVIAIALGILITLIIFDFLAFICIISGAIIGFWIRPEFDTQLTKRKKKKIIKLEKTLKQLKGEK